MILTRCPWYIAGPLLGLVIVVLRATVNRPLGAMGGYIDAVDTVLGPAKSRFGLWLLAGTIVGGFAFALATGRFSPSMDYALPWPAIASHPWLQPLLLMTAGAAIGLGARIAGGCTSGHGLCGMSLGSPASMMATLTFFAVAVVLAFLSVAMGATS
jgi:uncharacterized membrane protein YedE/YeeE